MKRITAYPYSSRCLMKKKRSLEIEGLPSAPAPGIQYNIVKLKSKNKIKKKKLRVLKLIPCKLSLPPQAI